MKTTKKKHSQMVGKRKVAEKKTYIGQTTYEWRCGSKA